MARDLDLPAAIVGCPTVREADGLALSSRNSYLGPEDRAAAPVLYRALLAARDAWNAGEREGETLRNLLREVLATEPRARVDYVSVADRQTLREVDRVEGPALLSLAVHVGPARLIDNVVVGEG
jgi:pantoate--beta-alanine ligase